MTPLDEWRQRLREAADPVLREAVGAHAWLEGEPPPGLVAIGAATVDWQRAARVLDADFDWPSLDRDPLLGASVRRAPGEGEPLILLLEPDTEGPLAAGLARFGEGPAAIYVRPRRLPSPALPTRRSARSGPFGAAWLLPGPRWGPHVVVLEPRATIDR